MSDKTKLKLSSIQTSKNRGKLVRKNFVFTTKKIKFKPENADFIILTTYVLRNFIRSDFRAKSFLLYNDPSTISSELQNIPIRGGSARQVTFEIRELYLNFFFNSAAGSVAWQNNKVSK